MQRIKPLRLTRKWRFGLVAIAAALLCGVASPVWGVVPTFSQSPSPLAQPITAQSWEQQGRSLYATGQFESAAIAFQSAAAGYQREGDTLRQALALSNIALCYQQVGHWGPANGAIASSRQLLEQSVVEATAQHSGLAQVLDIQGSLQLAQGQVEAAIATWEQAASRYQQAGEADRAIASRINQAQALQAAGLYRRAIASLFDVLGLQPPQQPSDPSLPAQLQAVAATPNTVAALHSLGESLRVTGNLTEAQAVVQQSLTLAEQLNQPSAIASSQFNLANVVYAQALADLNLNALTPSEAIALLRSDRAGRRFRNTDRALQFEQQIQTALSLYQQSAATPSASRLQAQLNQLNLLVLSERWSDAKGLISQLQPQIAALAPSRTAVYAQVNFAQSAIKTSQHSTEPTLFNDAVFNDAARQLSLAIQQAQTLEDVRSQSYATGALAGAYEQTQQWEEAERLTRQALLLSQSIEASDISYLWQWQLGRILRANHQIPAAIAAYKEAVNTLRLIRGDLIAIATAPERQFFFRNQIEPIHRELVSLLLTTDTNTPSANNLQTARDVIESLQLAELDNFFREACLTAKPEQIDQIGGETAVLYPILLPNQVAVIVKLPNRELTYYATAISENVTPQRIETTVNQLRQFLQQSNTAAADYLPLTQQLYDWLLRPVVADLQASDVQTLVFVLDGALRNLPMTVLHDGDRYLVENYGVAITLGLQLLNTRPVVQGRLHALVAGITESHSGFDALPNVDLELRQIGAQIQNSRLLIDQQFTNRNFQSLLSNTPYQVVHLATHGQFSSQLENTYILTWNGRINLNQFLSLLNRSSYPLDLLVLSACETAEGDHISALGLAGLAAQSGTRSTIGTLWQINDESTSKMMGQFYQSLVQVDTTKAAALQTAQLTLLNDPQYQHPYFWAPYVLIGNWQ